jgi:LuxR family transcriptional regulator, maltose regulon positive regulatory protein
MAAPILATKLYVPPPRAKIVARPRLIERLNEGLAMGCKLTLVSASAGFGKTSLISEWIVNCGRPVAWLSLDEGDNDPVRFIAYLVAALQTIQPGTGRGLLAELQSPQPPQVETILSSLINEISALPGHFLLVLDDFHTLDSQTVDRALAFLVEHQPQQMHLVIATREDPSLPLARLRARGQCTELRTADLRFTPAEAAEFLNRVMGLNLTDGDIAALEDRTEGWIAGLQMAAISMQGLLDAADFIQSFTGSHRFVLDYLLEEVLQRQPVELQTFLLRTSILERLCGPLCDAVYPAPAGSGQATLAAIERANLFIVPLDNERRWYRYHHLFGYLLRKRLGQNMAPAAIAELHILASQWYENNDLMLDAFHHAAAADDIERAERLIDGTGLHLHFRGVAAIRDWLASLPNTVLDARPSLWVRSAMLSLVAGQSTGVEEKLQAAEAALQGAVLEDKTRDLIGQIAAARATLAGVRHQPEEVITQARRALEYLHPDNLSSRCRANWTVGMAYMFRGERDAAGRAFAEALSIAQTSGSIIDITLAATCLGEIQELENQLYQAAETYRHALELLDDQPRPVDYRTYLGMARIFYEWNDLEAAGQHAQQSLKLVRRYDRAVDRFVIGEVFLARLKLAQGDLAGAAAMLAETELAVRTNNFVQRMPGVAAAQVKVLLKQGNLAAAADLARTHQLPLCQARVLLARGDPAEALAVLEPWRQQMQVKGWADEQLKGLVLQAVAQHMLGEEDQALQLLGELLALAEPEGFIRLFLDEGAPMAELLSAAAAPGIRPDYVRKLLAAFELEPRDAPPAPAVPAPSSMAEPLSPRELEVLGLIARGLSNHEICDRLFLALDTVKGHNRRIFEKLQVQRRTEAIARALELGLL